MIRLQLNDRTADALSKLYPYALGVAAMAFPLSPRIYTPVMVVTCLIWLLQLGRIRPSFRIDLLKRNYLAIAAIYAVQVVGLIYTTEWTESLKELETKSSLLVLPAIVLFSSLDRRQIRTVFWMFTAAIVIISVYLFFRSIEKALAAGDDLALVITGNLYQTTYFTEPLEIHPTYLSLFACLSIFFLADSMGKGRAWKNVLLVLLALFLTLVNGILISRGALIGFVLGGLAFIVHRFAFIERKPVIVLAVMLVFAAIVISAFVYIPNFRLRFTEQAGKLKQYWDGYYPDSSTSLHIYSWKCSFHLIKERPFLGYGTGDEVERLMDCYREFDLTKSLENRYNAHNEFLSGMLRHGVFGLLVLIFFFCYAGVQAIRYQDSLFIAFLVLFLTVSMFESTLNVYRGVVFLAMFESLLIRNCALKKGSPGQLRDHAIS